MRFWRIASDEPNLFSADDLTGAGARRAGARWNEKGTPTVYASYHLSAAVLETLVHLGRRRQPINRYVVAIDVNDTWFKYRDDGIVQLDVRNLPEGWDAHPPDLVSQLFGAEQFKHGRIGFAVPSAIVHEELNLVLNPRHPAFKKAVRAQVTRTFAFDPRL